MKVITSKNFEKEAKKLIKKYFSLGKELALVIKDLEIKPTQGTPIGKDCYKIRLAISSKGKGKSGGARAVRRSGYYGGIFNSRKSRFAFNL